MQDYWDNFYKYYDSIMYSYLPLSTMLVFNVAIVTKLVVAKMKRSSDTVGGTSLSKTSHSVTVMLVCSIIITVTIVPILAIVTKLVKDKQFCDWRNKFVKDIRHHTVLLSCWFVVLITITCNSNTVGGTELQLEEQSLLDSEVFEVALCILLS